MDHIKIRCNIHQQRPQKFAQILIKSRLFHAQVREDVRRTVLFLLQPHCFMFILLFTADISVT
jgi:hypothetical protein